MSASFTTRRRTVSARACRGEPTRDDGRCYGISNGDSSVLDDLAGARRLIISALFFCLAGCAAAPPQQLQPHQFLTVHLEDSDNKAAHDEIQVPGGLIVEDYPDRISPRRIYFRYPQGGIMDLTCRNFSNNPCRDWTMRITGFKSDHMPKGFDIFLPEGTYLLLNTDDP